jgi:hypothetical protein
MKEDVVNHPKHYTDPSGIECIEISRELPFDMGNAFKYVFRAGKKYPSKALEDIEKAEFYIKDGYVPMDKLIKGTGFKILFNKKSILKYKALKNKIYEIEKFRSNNIKRFMYAFANGYKKEYILNVLQDIKNEIKNNKFKTFEYNGEF